MAAKLEAQRAAEEKDMIGTKETRNKRARVHTVCTKLTFGIVSKLTTGWGIFLPRSKDSGTLWAISYLEHYAQQTRMNTG